MLKLFFASNLLILLALTNTTASADEVQQSEKLEATTEVSSVGPKLIVVISVDQLRRDRLNIDFPGFLGRLKNQGRDYVDANLAHGISTTCGGHTAILTGMSPGPAGIPGNTYVDYKTFLPRYCVDDLNDAYRVIQGKGNRSPNSIKVGTFGDWLKSKNMHSKVYSIGGKDRATIAMGGKSPDGVFWFDKNTGRFTSSQFYMQTLPTYIDDFNGKSPLFDGYLQDVEDFWQHAKGQYRKDDYQGESDMLVRHSGHPLAKAAQGENAFEQIYYSPVIDTKTIDLAKLIVNEEKLGLGDDPDLLILALSATDTVGHLYGPRSAESEATLKNVDQQLSSLATALELSVGKDNILWVLTADHGVAELPEYTTEQGVNQCPEQGRVAAWPLVLGANFSIYWRYTRPFDLPSKLIQFAGGGFTFNRQYIKENNLNLNDIVETMDRVLSKNKIVKDVWTQAEIKEGKGEVAQLLKKSFVEGKSEDLLLQLHRDCVITLGEGTTHGSVYNYDRDIPLIFLGWQVDGGQIQGDAHSVDIAPTLAEHIGLKMPVGLEGRVLELGLKNIK